MLTLQQSINQSIMVPCPSDDQGHAVLEVTVFHSKKHLSLRSSIFSLSGFHMAAVRLHWYK